MRRCVAVLLALVLALAGCTNSGPGQPKPSELNGFDRVGQFDGAGLDPAQPRPSFTLTTTSGKRFSFGTVTAGHPTLLYFGYTNCPDICPETMADIRLALQKVPVALARSTYVVFVTTDVKHDTGPVLAKWLSNFSAGSKATFVGLRGTQAQIDAAQAAAHVALAQDDGQTHSAQTLLYGTDDYAHVSFLQSVNLRQQIEHDLPLVAKV
ncbi:MAG TPA: SCO family protein [Jatrophihabitans sp.]|nr:SCO family protein [Jatrophihabitans sp.]